MSTDTTETTPPSVPIIPGIPTSPFFAVRQTPHSGRAVFATTFIPADTLVYRATDLTLSVLLREYRREVCGWCFGYEYGRDLSVVDKTVGFAFCGENCRVKWRTEGGKVAVGVQAWMAVEKLTKGRGKEDSEMVEMDLPRPRPKEIREAWEGVKARAELIRVARMGGGNTPNTEPVVRVTNQHRKAVQKAIADTISPDVMTFCVSGILFHYSHPDQFLNIDALACDYTPYHSADDLQAFTRTYLQLLAILPVPLLPHCTPEILITLSQRDSHNSFGIRSLEDDGSEFFGYGCWPSASYFNHSCGPNVEKQRVGRVWEFRTGREVEEGEELCITYLSGEERRLSRGKRMETLNRNWGFECGCERCEL
ncbi:SET domain-containing protein [Delitschia confertaspora ATCC 74209]|uniref:SET domain-containing protein n=1 Tax=Delitschia confertaspora ATCC 74209 TaxID=1513339 RepID=A0A9P4JW38_9PLEO|nr:SET domain-containing protein [Delitschia confertaspora ATCC 74209]